jgi:hypothetical protein
LLFAIKKGKYVSETDQDVMCVSYYSNTKKKYNLRRKNPKNDFSKRKKNTPTSKQQTTQTLTNGITQEVA